MNPFARRSSSGPHSVVDSSRWTSGITSSANRISISSCWCARVDIHDDHFDIKGCFEVPRSPQGQPVLLQAGDSSDGRDFAAGHAEVIFSRHGTLADGQAFYADVKGRLGRYGRDRDGLKILPGASFALGETHEEAQDNARGIALQQVGPQTAIAFLEQVWGRDLSAYDRRGRCPTSTPPRTARSLAGGYATSRTPGPWPTPGAPGPGPRDSTSGNW